LKGPKQRLDHWRFKSLNRELSQQQGYPCKVKGGSREHLWIPPIVMNFKAEFQNENLSKGVPRNYILAHHDKLLRVMQRYFTCEGSFNKVYMYHIRLLMHFTSKKSINLPYCLSRSLGKMVDKVQDKSNQFEPNVFNFSLIKLLVLEELKKEKREWNSFMNASRFCAETINSPPSKGSTPYPSLVV
jgi:hypothetical protein